MTEIVLMSDELENKIQLEDRPKQNLDTELCVRFTRDGKKSKKLSLRAYEEFTENTVTRHKLELLLEKEEFLSVVKIPPTGFQLLVGDESIVTKETPDVPLLRVTSDNGRFNVQLMF